MTAPGRTVVRRVPGKLFVAGEYAVVDPGSPAILVAVDRHVTVTVSDPGAAAPAGAAVTIRTDLGPRETSWHWHVDRLVACGTDDDRPAHDAPDPVVSAVETVCWLLRERGWDVPELTVSISSRLHEDGRKYGLGSSGAVTVATVWAVAAYCGVRLSHDERYRLAMLATARIDPRASGGDLAASTWGGWIAYQAPDRDFVLDLARRLGVERAIGAPWPGHAVRRLPPPEGLTLQVGWTGEPASSTALVGRLHKKAWRGTGSHRRFVAASGDLVRGAVTALQAGDRDGLLDRVRAARGELARLDEEAGLGIFTPELTRLCDAAEAVGGAAKPSGAGGGDCGIALLDADAVHDIDDVHGRWAAAGVLPLPLRPALEGIEA